ncbi:hypothetical protein HCH06_17885 [Enterobacter ludwigii]|uniref:hypothetical protein n=1 Tax=Enterobacter ludwigii TaxID=299767 RepID=UPI001C8C7336|nr:hypothetical protein [Enterobacter ludwigii]MBX9031233.1 hypothetical protein [Enterobacter ludwigii]
MKEFKGMRGPWVASKTDRSIGPVSRDDDQSYGMILPVAWVEFDGNDAHQQANANLIAAAPDLLEALQAMLSKAYKQNWNDQYPDELSKAQAAISKALGEE